MWVVLPLPLSSLPPLDPITHPSLRPHAAPSSLRLYFKSTHRPRHGRRACCPAPSAFSPKQPAFPPAPSLSSLAAAAVFFLAVGTVRASTNAPPALPPLVPTDNAAGEQTRAGTDAPLSLVSEDDDEMKAAFEKWKSKTFALTVPLRIVSLRGSIPPSWIKEFTQVQGRRLKLQVEFRATLESVFSELSLALKNSSLMPKSAMAADLVTIGDSWLSLALSRGLIEPIEGAEELEWFKRLNDRWKVYLRRNHRGNLESDGKIWGVPYRWGCMVIAYKKNKFREHNLAPVEDWCDLWRPELAGKISMVDSPREIVGAVLKHMGASYNTRDIDIEVPGGKKSAIEMLKKLQRQVRLFDSVNYLKPFGVGDAWVAVGWSSDVLPAAKRMSNVVVVVPRSGSSLWADLWVVPAANKINTNKIGGRVRGPSPLVDQWIEFCLQAARALPFQEGVIPGASPFAIVGSQVECGPFRSSQGKPKLETNLEAGIPPLDILAKCEFLEPLSNQANSDYKWLIGEMQKSNKGRLQEVWDCTLSFVCSLLARAHGRGKSAN